MNISKKKFLILWLHVNNLEKLPSEIRYSSNLESLRMKCANLFITQNEQASIL